MAALFHRPLLATECSEFDTGAQLVALGLARRSGQVLPVVLPLTSNPEFEAVAPALAAKAEAEAHAKVDILRREAQTQGVALDVQVRRGPEPYAEIVAHSRELGTDLLIIRRRGRRGFLANLLVGEMVSKVVAHAACPVVVCPREARPWQRAVLVGLDPLVSQPDLLAQAVAIAQAERLALHVVAVATDATRRPLAEAAAAAAVHEARRQGVAAQGEARTGRPHEQLIAAARDRGGDLLVIARHGPNNLSRAWIGGVAQKVIGLAECPVWIHVPAAAGGAP